jgi:hypothetical protein
VGTLECIAEFTRSPLMVLTSSDIGTQPDDVEWRLTRNFKTAKSWGAVLLIDEADVFMERRTTADLTRNSLVAGTQEELLTPSPSNTMSKFKEGVHLTSDTNDLQASSAPSNSTTAFFSSRPTASAPSTTPSSHACISSYTTPISPMSSASRCGRRSSTSWRVRGATTCG